MNMSKLFIIGSLSNMDYIKKVGDVYRRQGYEVTTVHNQPFKTPSEIVLNTYRTIEETDAVIAVTKKDGSFGDGTTYEIAFASHIGKPVRVLNHIDIDKMVKPTLNEKERKFLELLNPDHYMARDEDGALYIHNHKPDRGHHGWIVGRINNLAITPWEFLDPSIKFDFITWDDEKPWKIEDLLKLD
jgi:nucleoside 2-deoxyribosyltransferase